MSYAQLEELASSNPEALTHETFRWLSSMAEGRLSVLLHELFGQIDQSLFDRADEARGEHAQNDFAEGLREVRHHREAMIACFKAQLTRDFLSLEASGEISPPDDADPEDPEAVSRPLKPLSESAMRSLTALQSESEDRCFRALNELNQHLYDLHRMGEQSLVNNPLSPGNLCRNFQYAVNLIDLAEEVEQIVCEKFARYVIHQLPFVLDFVNQEMRQVAKLKDAVSEEPRHLNNLFATVKGLLATKRAAQQKSAVKARATVDRAPVTAAESDSALDPGAKPWREPEPETEPASAPPPGMDGPSDDHSLPDGVLEEAEPEWESREADAPAVDSEPFEIDEGPSAEPDFDDIEEQPLELLLDDDDDDLPLDWESFSLDDEAEAEPEVGIAEEEEPQWDASSDVLPAVESSMAPDALPEIPELPPLPTLAQGEQRIIQTVDILAVLEEMQVEQRDFSDFAPSSDGDLGETGVSHHLLARLAERRPEYRDAPYSEEDEGTIDLVDLVFDFVLHDHNLPVPLQSLLAKLQVPYLRVALLDWRLFALAEHPARKLLDELARAAQGWSAESDINNEIYRRIEAVTETITQDFEGNPALYGQLYQSFSRFMEHFESRAAMEEKRALAAVRERERLTALRAATESIRRRMLDRVPALIDEILRRIMPEVLVMRWLDHGSDSDEWQASLDLVDDLVASGSVCETDEEVEQLLALIPRVMTGLDQGLDLLLFEPERRQQIAEELINLWRQRVPEAFRERILVPDESVDEKPTQASGEGEVSFDQAVQMILGDVPESGKVVSPQALHEALAGSWFEFKADGENHVRAKLSWEMPVSARFLFVDQNGHQIAEKSLDQLAGEIRAGEAVILESIPLFERALSAIAERLMEESGGGQPAP